MKEIINKLNDLKIKQKSMDFEEDLPEDIEKYFEDIVASDLDVDKHRWYETSMKVYKIDEGFIGVVSITDLFSESGSVDDCDHTLEFYAVREKSVITYEIIK